MTQRSQPSIFRRLLPGLIVSLAAVLVLYFLVDLKEVQRSFALADYRWLPLVGLLFIGTLLARAKAWRTTMLEEASMRDTFFVLNQGYLLNNVLPFRLGELGRAVLLAGRTGASFWRVFSTVVIERIFDVAFAAGLLLLTLPLVVGAEWARSAALVAASLVVVGFAALFFLANKPELVESLVRKLSVRWPRLQNWLGEKLDAFIEGLSSLRNPVRFLSVAFWLFLSWVFNLAWYYTLMYSFFGEARLLWAAFAIGFASLGVALPSSPAYIGVLEGAVVAALTLFGIGLSLALAYALASHVIYLIITSFFGVIGFTQESESLGALYSRLLNREKEAQLQE